MEYEELKQICLSCEKCELSKTRTNVVFGTGNPNSEIMFIGEGPGQMEDETGLPFVGRSGKLLDQYLNAIHLYRDKNIYIANIVKCRPPQNRDPLPNEWEACMPYLRQQFKLIRPKIVVCLGRVAAQRIIKPDFAIMKEHGQWFDKGGTLFTATLHPAALLRNPNNKPLAFEDFVSIRKKIEEICDHTY
ncbi:MAG: uracil-DNA glycosylase [Clostridia bacterium]|nr:uracil-DNA glycosylase [Clostridia bacterium]NLS84111.1 uracil-DNA glycosylase [Oscillospiraceae bacterium]